MKLPVLGICGYSGSGKTTLIESLIPYLTSKGFRVLTIKHDVHGLNVDRPGKDSDRFFRAGSDVMANGPGEGLVRRHDSGTGQDLESIVREMIQQYDLILVEGHKFTPLPDKIWLRRNSADRCPKEVTGVMCDLDRGDDRPAEVKKMLDSWFRKVWMSAPVYGGILIGGESSRMGKPKHLIRKGNRTWLESTIVKVRPFVKDVVILGKGLVPDKLRECRVLPDVEGRRGPVAGMLSAMRWNPLASWIFVACDLPMINGHAVRWLMSKRSAGVWAVMPVLPGKEAVEPLLAYYDFRARSLLENCARPADIAGNPRVAVLETPLELALSWTNINRPTDLKRIDDSGLRTTR